MAATLDGEVVLHVPGRTGLSGRYQGADAVRGLCAHVSQLTAGTLRFEPSRVLDETDDLILIEGRVRGSHPRAEMDTAAVHVLSLRAGRIREVWLFNEDQGLVDEFWASCC